MEIKTKKRQNIRIQYHGIPTELSRRTREHTVGSIIRSPPVLEFSYWKGPFLRDEEESVGHQESEQPTSETSYKSNSLSGTLVMPSPDHFFGVHSSSSSSL